MALTQMQDLAKILARDLAAGAPARQSLGSRDVVWGWTEGLPVTIADFIAQGQTEGITYGITRIEPTGTPAAIVAEGAPKPKGVAITSESAVLTKHAGLAEVTLEQATDAQGLLAALAQVLGAQALMSFELEAMANLDTATQTATPATTWLGAIAAGQAEVLGAGGRPSVVILPAIVWAAVTTELGQGAGFATDPRSPVGALWGSAIHVTPAGTKAFVLDSNAATAVSQVDSPTVLLDPYSLSGTNQVRLVADLFATVEVSNPALIVEVAGPAPVTARRSSSSSK